MEFRLPDIGEGVAEGEIVKWLVSAGQEIREDEPLVEVMTDKATVTITSPVTSQVAELRAAEGETVAVGAVIVCFGEDASAPAASAPAASSAEAAALPASSSPAPTPASRGRVLATPSTRRRARELDVDIRQVVGTGPHGRVTLDDVLGHHATPPSAPTPSTTAGPIISTATATPTIPPTPVVPPIPMAPPTPLPLSGVSPEDQRIPLRGVRRIIAQAMARSTRTAAHFTYVEEVDVTELVALRQRGKSVAAERGVKLTYLPFIIKAVIASLRRFPNFNAHMDDARDELVVRGDIHLGIAADTPDGLVVPVLRHADRRSMLDIGRELARLGEAARTRSLSPEELKGSTFTISSAGSIGGLLATPILNYPEVAILGVHKIKERPIVRDGELAIGQIMYLSMSLDHRVIDGADAARFMNSVVRYLEAPELLLLEAV